MIVSYCVFNALWLFVWLYFARKEIDIKVSMFIRDILPYMLLSSFVMAVAYVSTMAIENLYLLFVAKAVIAASLYVLIARLTRSEELNEIKEFLYK